MSTDNELLEDISSKLSDVNNELDDVSSELGNIKIEIEDTNLELQDFSLFVIEQQILNLEISEFMENKTLVDANINYQLDTQIQLKSYDFIFVALIIGILLILVVMRGWRKL